MTKSFARWMPLLLPLAALPALIPLWLILAHAVDMPYWDHWNKYTAGLYIGVHQGTATLHDFLALQNEHRPVIPRLIYLFFNLFTHWNTNVECLAEWVFAFSVSIGLLWLFRLTEPKDLETDEPRSFISGRSLVCWFICNLLIFSPAQWENWLFGMGMVNVTPIFWMTPAFVLLAALGVRWWTAIVAMFLCTLATYTNGCGLFFWPLIGGLLAWSSSWQEFKVKKWILVTFAIWMVINIGLYFVGYSRPSHGGAQLYTMSLSAVFIYIMAFSGNLFAFGTSYAPMTFAPIVGGALLTLLLGVIGYFFYAWLKLKDYEICRKMLFWLAVAGTSVMNAVISGFARAGTGAQGALSSRYITFSLFLPVALAFLVPIICHDIRRRFGNNAWVSRFFTQVPAALGAAVVLLTLAAIPPGVNASNAIEMQRRMGKGALLLLNVLPDNPRLTTHVCAEIDLIKTQAPILSQMGYIHPPLIASNNATQIQGSPELIGGVKGQIDQLGRTTANEVAANGWAVFPGKSAPADAIFLTYENEKREPIIFAFADIGAPRNDVVEALGESDYAQCGWIAILPMNRIPNYLAMTNITAWALDTDTGKAYKLDGARTVKLQ